jgi:signal transduction histidine kinase
MNRASIEATRHRPLLLDIGMVLLLALLSLVLGRSWLLTGGAAAANRLTFVFGSLDAWRLHLLLWWAATAIALGALVARRRVPVVAFLVAGAMVIVHASQPAFPRLPADLAAPIALYAVASHARRRVAIGVLAVALCGAYALSLLPDKTPIVRAFTPDGDTALTAALLLLVAWFAGDSARARRADIARAERDRDQQAQLAAAAERNRITRELHDVVAHGVSLIVVQAQGAQTALDMDHPEQTRQALRTIVATGRQSLGELRSLLGVVRDSPQTGPDLAPQPSLDRLPELIEQIRHAGIPVELRLEGPARPLPPGVDLSAFRIVQEALTNTMKHAGHGASARIRLRYLDDAVEVEVVDSGTGEPPAGPRARNGEVSGHGLTGMRERATVLGGRLEAGPCPGGGFRVHAWLPLEVITT